MIKYNILRVRQLRAGEKKTEDLCQRCSSIAIYYGLTVILWAGRNIMGWP